MIDIAVRIAQNLHFDVTRPQDHFFKIAFTVAKGGLGFAAPLENFRLEFVLTIYRPHAAPTATPAGFEHQRIADGGGLAFDGFDIIAQNLGGRDNRNTGGNRHFARGRLVAERPHGGGFWSNKADTSGVAGIDEIRIFRQQAVSWVNCISA